MKHQKRLEEIERLEKSLEMCINKEFVENLKWRAGGFNPEAFTYVKLIEYGAMLRGAFYTFYEVENKSNNKVENHYEGYEF